MYYLIILFQILQLPDNFKADVISEKVKGARSISVNGNNIYVGTRSVGSVYHLELNKDYQSVKDINVIAEDLYMPNGVAYKYGALYVAEVNRVIVFKNIDLQIKDKKYSYDIVRDDFPSDSHHGWKYLKIGPDDKLYVPVGAPCNICELEDDYGALFKVSLDGKKKEKLATGIRNTVGFDWHPVTGNLWFSDNGRDWLGDDLPPEEINILRESGEHFGYPYLHGKTVKDPEYWDKKPELNFSLPVLEIQAHSAALGMLFYTGKMFPKKYHNQLFVALHGSWNRSKKVGYKVIVVHLSSNQSVDHVEDFMTGLLDGENVYGRPVDIAQLGDGSILISDDYKGKIIRVSYEE